MVRRARLSARRRALSLSQSAAVLLIVVLLMNALSAFAARKLTKK